MRIAETLALLTAGYVVLSARGPAGQTTLKTAWRVMAAAVAAWALVWAVDLAAGRVDPKTANFLWYAVAVLMLCPPIAVLGARQPVANVWAWFVLLPLVLVFSIPALVAWTAARRLPVLELELPVTIAYGLVSFMGAGNYFGTRYTCAALLGGAASLLLLASVSQSVPAWISDPEVCRSWATVLLGIAFAEAWRVSNRKTTGGSVFDVVWRDFRDWFGIVWARRVQVRVNEAAANQRWLVHLELQGFAATEADSAGGSTEGANVDAKIDHTLRWLLRRFVDDEWIDRRLGGIPGPENGERGANTV